MRDEVTGELIARGKTALRLGVVVLLGLTLTNYAVGCVIGMNARFDKSLTSLADDHWEVTECLYAAAITVTAVGYTDALGSELCEIWVDAEGRRRWRSNEDFHEDPGFDEATAVLDEDWSPVTRVVTSLEVIVGMAFFLYVVAQVTTFFHERGHTHLMTTLRTRRALARMDEHVVVCGMGRAARRAVEKLLAEGVPCVVVDEDPDELRRYRLEQPDVPCIVGDATKEDALIAARVSHARALLALMPDDTQNLITLFSARELAPDLHVVCRGLRTSSAPRLTAAGADTVIGIEALAGLRAASELIRPTVVDFLDSMMRGEGESAVHFEGIPVAVTEGTLELRALGLPERAGVHAVAIRRRGQTEFQYNPSRSEVLADGDEIVVLGNAQQVARAREVLRSPLATPGELPVEPATMEIAMGALALSEEADAERRDHYVVCGGGLVGGPILSELLVSGRRAVLVDRDPVHGHESVRDLPEGAAVRGDALDPDVLREAGVTRARGLVTALPSDHDNLVVVVTARQLRPGLRMVAVAREQRAQERLERAGARVISLDLIAGRRMAADVLRPHATTFLDRMRAAAGGTRFEGVVVTADGGAVGRTLAELRVFDRTGMRVLALRRSGERGFLTNPSGSTRLESGTVLVVVGEPLQVQLLANLIGRVE